MTRRLFLAIPVPEEIQTYLEDLKKANRHIQGVKWMKDYNLHLTIYFIGNMDENTFDELIKCIDITVQNFSSFVREKSNEQSVMLEFDKICFAPDKKPKMIWVRFHKHDLFTQLVALLHKSLKPLIPNNKFYFENPFPHITLARFHPIKELENFNIPQLHQPLSIHISSFDLWESTDTLQGVRYNTTGFTYKLNDAENKGYN
ncbi:MAG: RNA 2',3'-cyclic phosphodiesterase [Daejeonella sp.]